jgi:hypothetical protein
MDEARYRVAFEDAAGSTFEKNNPELTGPRVPNVGEIIIMNDVWYRVRQVRWYTQPGNRVQAHLRATELGQTRERKAVEKR